MCQVVFCIIIKIILRTMKRKQCFSIDNRGVRNVSPLVGKTCYYTAAGVHNNYGLLTAVILATIGGKFSSGKTFT